MEQVYIQVTGQLLAAAAELEGMKAANQERVMRNESLAYGEGAFIEKAEEITNITNQLFR